MAESAFLDRQGSESYATRDGRLVRHVVPTGADSDAQEEPEPFNEAILRVLSRGRSQRGLAGLVLAVHPGDGMSWAAHVADDMVARHAPELHRFYLRGAPGLGLPEICSALIPVRTLARLARRHKLTDVPVPLGRVAKLGVLFIALLIGTFAAWLVPASRADRTSLEVLGSMSFLLPAMATVAIGLALPYILYAAKPGTGRDWRQRRIVDLERARSEHPDEFRTLAESLGDVLGEFRGSRAVIIDRFDRLDDLTRATLLAYLGSSRSTNRFELWIVIESSTAPQVTRAVVRRRVDTYLRGFRLDLLRQLPLTEEERYELAMDVGRPERAGFSWVRSICEWEDPDDAEVVGYLDQAAGPRQQGTYHAIDLLALLALDAVRPSAPLVPVLHLATALAKPSPAEAQVLQFLLPGLRLSAGGVNAALDEVQRSFSDICVIDNKSLRVTREAAVVLEARSTALGLPRPRHGSLFWCLFWFRHLAPATPGPYWVEKLCMHALACAFPDELDLDADTVSSLNAELLRAITFAIRSAMRTCVLDTVVPLLEKAAVLIDSTDVNAMTAAHVVDGQFDDITALCWQCFDYLGDTRLVDAALQLARRVVQQTGPRSIEIDPDSVLHALDATFVAALPATPEVDTGDRFGLIELVVGLGSAPAVVLYHRTAALGLWAVLADEQAQTPFYFPSGPVCFPASPEAVLAGAEALRSPMSALLGITDASPKSPFAITALASALWITVAHRLELLVATELWPPQDTVSSAQLASLVESMARDVDGVVRALTRDLNPGWLEAHAYDEEFLHDCAAREFAIVAAACASIIATVAQRLGSDAGSDSLTDIARWSNEVLGLSHVYSRHDPAGFPVRDRLEAQLDLVQATWQALGLNQQAASSSVRRAHFSLLSRRLARVPTGVGEAIEVLHSVGARTGYPALMANLISADYARASGQVRARPLSRAAQAALSYGMGNVVTTPMCVVAAASGQLYPSISLDPELQHLLEQPSPGEPRRLQAYLDQISDLGVPGLMLDLHNIALRDPARDAADIVENLFEARGRKIEQEHDRKQLEEHLSIARVRRMLKRRQSIDVTAVLEEWEERRSSPAYAYLLYLLLGEDPDSQPLIVRAGVDCLSDSSTHNGLGAVYLAESLILLWRAERATLSDEERTRVLRALEVAQSVNKGLLEIDLNIHVLEVLQREMHPTSTREALLLELKEQKLADDEASLLPSLLRRGSLFQVFAYYVELLAGHGLRLTLDLDSFIYLRDMRDREASRELITTIQNEGVWPPRPFVRTEAGMTVNAEFVISGYCVFSPALADIADMDVDRRQVDQSARDAMKSLFLLMQDLPTLPVSLRHRIRRHGRRVSEGLPTSTSNGAPGDADSRASSA